MEVEVKFPYSRDAEEKVRKIAKPVAEKFEHDVYFSHPCRDFALTDEAIRIRRDAEGITLTYKGPKVDAETKSREEIKVRVDDFDAASRIFEKLGFKPVAEVKKIRRIYGFEDAIICIDDVEGLGKFVEIEIEAENLEVKEKVFQIARLLGYSKNDSIRESYLELILQKKLRKDPSKTGQKS
uniref:Class IV adenylate cyclase n=1 Tax=Archaeoglobus fulgidus TaxID=2234 RepID=A0A7C3MBQ7_ARCFL